MNLWYILYHDSWVLCASVAMRNKRREEDWSLGWCKLFWWTMQEARSSCGFLSWERSLQLGLSSVLQHKCTCSSQSNTLLCLSLSTTPTIALQAMYMICTYIYDRCSKSKFKRQYVQQVGDQCINIHVYCLHSTTCYLRENSECNIIERIVLTLNVPWKKDFAAVAL